MTNPKNTEDQELSLDQLKDAAGGFGAKMNRMVSTHDEAGMSANRFGGTSDPFVE